jgi:aryl-alcohol dehydrogenase-like predicted oxidoreductase
MAMQNTQALTSKLGLGTAQFGLDSPRGGARSPEAEVREMLASATRAGLCVLDTGAASTHGEAVLGAVMPRPVGIRVTVKAPRGDRGPMFVESEARASLARLGLNRADAIMVQSAGDLFSPYGAAWWSCLKTMRDDGMFARVGISAYASDDPAGLARRFQPDLIQAPASLLDQRLLVDGSLARVRDMGVEVHLRSIFLNGLLFLPPDRAPSQIGEATISRLSRARRLIAEGRSDPLQAALGFALSRPEATAVIVGAATVGELNAVIAASAKPPPDLDWDGMALENPEDINPRRWAAA